MWTERAFVTETESDRRLCRGQQTLVMNDNIMGFEYEKIPTELLRSPEMANKMCLVGLCRRIVRVVSRFTWDWLWLIGASVEMGVWPAAGWGLLYSNKSSSVSPSMSLEAEALWMDRWRYAGYNYKISQAIKHHHRIRAYRISLEPSCRSQVFKFTFDQNISPLHMQHHPSCGKRGVTPLVDNKSRQLYWYTNWMNHECWPGRYICIKAPAKRDCGWNT